MIEIDNAIETAFFRGDYNAVIRQRFDVAKRRLDPAETPWVIGSLCFTGRLVEAVALHADQEASLGGPEAAASRYFLAIAHLRHNSFPAAVKLLLANVRAARAARGSSDAALLWFYAAQAMGFTRYRSGRLVAALRWAEKAQSAAVEADFLYGRIHAGDLLGHVRVNAGQVRRGLREFERTADLAAALGPGAISQALKATRVIYRARFGVASPAVADEELSEEIERCRFEDSYTLASLHLERARVARLRGDVSAERTCLDQAVPLVYAVRSPHLEAQLNIRLAYARVAAGDGRQGLELVRHALQAIDASDITLTVRLKGLEARCLRAVGQDAEAAEVAEAVATLSRRGGQRVAQRILQRGTGVYQADAMRGDDPLGDVIDEATRNEPQAPSVVIASGWLGLLHDVLGLAPSERAVVFDLELGAVTLFDRGDVVHVSDGVSPLARKLIEALGRGAQSKEQLIESVWGLRYHPLKHDALIYALVAKLRRALGTRGHWIQATDDGYGLLAGLAVRCLAKDVRERDGVEAPRAGAPATPPDLPPLNPRQLAVLRALRAGEYFDVQRGMSAFEASDATVSRDFAKLVELGLVTRVGKGRATKYKLHPNASSDARSPHAPHA